MGADGEKKKDEGEGPKVGVIYLTVFLDFFASGVVLPLLQTHAKGELGASGYNVGLVFTAYSAASIVGSFILGRMSDYIGRRPIILVSLLMSTVTLYMTAVADSLDMLIKTRALAGFFSETSVCQAYIADKTLPEDRPRYIGHMGAFIGLGFMVGPATGAMLAAFGGFTLASYFTTAVTALNFVYAVARLDESLGSNPEGGEAKELQPSWGEYFKSLANLRILLVLLSQFGITFAFMSWNTTWGNWAADRLGYDRKHVGWAFAWLSMALVLAMWKARARVKGSPSSSLKASLLGNAMMALSLVAHRFITSTWGIFIPLFLLGFGYGLSELVYQTVTSLSSSKALQGSMLGTLASITALARAVAPVAAGYLFDLHPDDSDYAYTVMACFPLAAMVLSPLCCRTVVESAKKEE